MVVKLRRQLENISKRVNHPKVYRGRLAEDYDGIGQFILVSMSQAATTSAYKAQIAVGDFGTGQPIPAGTPVTLASSHGRIMVLSLGAK